MILLVLWLGHHWGISGLGVGGLLYLGQAWLGDRLLARREMRRFDAMPGGYRDTTQGQ